MFNRTILVMALAVAATPALAQERETRASNCGPSPAPRQVFTSIFKDFGQLASRETVGIAALGGIAAASAHAIDADVEHHLPGSADSGFRPGAILGGTPFALGAATATYAFGRIFDKPCGSALGADLIRAEVMAEALSTGLKEVTRRSRPQGSGFSFPSGHTTVAFASATVLQRHFGWKVGVPAYGVAAYVAASRVEMKRHYLSDVAFGAALGIVAGRTVTVGRTHRFMVTPLPAASGTGGGVGLTLLR